MEDFNPIQYLREAKSYFKKAKDDDPRNKVFNLTEAIVMSRYARAFAARIGGAEIRSEAGKIEYDSRESLCALLGGNVDDLQDLRDDLELLEYDIDRFSSELSRLGITKKGDRVLYREGSATVSLDLNGTFTTFRTQDLIALIKNAKQG